MREVQCFWAMGGGRLEKGTELRALKQMINEVCLV